MSNFYRDLKREKAEDIEQQAINRAIKQIIAFKEEKGYLLNGNVSMICQRNNAKVRPVRAKLRELGITK